MDAWCMAHRKGHREARPPRGRVRPPKAGRLFLLLWLVPALVSAAGFVRMRVLPVPAVTSLSPTQVKAGAPATLTLRGHDLRNGVAVSFGTGIEAEPISAAGADGRRARIRLRVAPSAPLGRHQLILTVGGQRHPQPIYITVQPAPRVNGSHLPPMHIQQGTPPAATMAPPRASLLSKVTPGTVHTGRRVQLVLEGRDFRRGLRVDYGPGIHVESVTVTGDQRATAVVRIDANARAGRRLPRASEPGVRVSVQAGAALTVLASVSPKVPQMHVKKPPPRPGRTKQVEKKKGFAGFAPRTEPRVLNVTPRRFEPGKRYSVTVYGTHLPDGLQLRLGQAIDIESVEVLNARSAKLSLHVGAKAEPGTRRVRIRAGSNEAWAPQPAAVRVQRPFRQVSLPRPKLSKPNWQARVKGTILLQGPKWYSGFASVSHKDPMTGKVMGTEVVRTGVAVPSIKDDDVFTWREQNPGLAEWFEVRFYRGKKLIAKRKVKASHGTGGGGVLPTWLMPDPKLIMTLAQALPTVEQQSFNKSKASGFKSNHNAGAHGSTSKKADTDALPPSDLTWEVVGYRRYYQSGVERRAARERLDRPVMLASIGGVERLALAGGLSQPTNGGSLGTMVPREVERSERWPLNLPARPSGMGCGSEVRSNLDVIPVSGGIANAVHTGDRWKLTGTLDLEFSPWASHPQTSQPVKVRGNKALFTTWRFDNVYVDWGDGTVVPLAASQHGDQGDYAPGDAIDLSRITEHYRHAFSLTGSYTVRVYQLAEGDIQQESAGNVSAAVNHDGTLYGAATRYGGGKAHDDESEPRRFAHAKAVGDRAYMLMCTTVEVDPRHDPASDGPLTLVAAKLRGFPQAPGDDTPPDGVTVAPSSESSPFALHQAGRGGGQSQSGSKQLGKTLAPSQPSLTAHDITQIFHLDAAGEPSFSACDVAMSGGGYTYYYGQGSVRWTWYVDGNKIGARTIALGPSVPRSDQVLAGKDPGSPLVSASSLQTSPRISLEDLGEHRLSFDVQVLYDASGLKNLTGLMGDALGAGNRKPDKRLAGQISAGMHGAPPLGVLPPPGVKWSGGADPVAWLNRPLQRVARSSGPPVLLAALSRSDSGGSVALGQAIEAAASTLPTRGPPSLVASNSLAYKVVGYDQSKPCRFKFPVQGGGEFIVGGLQDNGSATVHHNGNHWNGTGTLLVTLPGGGGPWPVPLKIKDWSLKPDGTTVASGSFDLVNPIDTELAAAGARLQVKRLRGKAGDSVQMTLRAAIKNPNIRESAGQKAPPPMVATAALSPHGDWYADGLSLPKLGVYDSGFTLNPTSVLLDLSATRGSACGAGAKGWMGFAFGDGARLQAFTFHLKKTQQQDVSGWGIDASGWCGQAKFASYHSDIEKGSIRWDGVDAHAGGGAFSATYHGVRVHVPWLDTELTGGDQRLLSGKGSGGEERALNLHGDAPQRRFGPVTLDADDLQFTALKDAGPAVRAGTTLFGFTADGHVFARDVAVPNLYFGMDGKAYFDASGGSTHVTLSGTQGELSEGVVDLKGLDVVATPGQQSRLLFNFSTELRISQALPAAPAPVSYHLDEPSVGQYVGFGPATGQFVIHKPFPDANPSTDTVIRPVYVGPQKGATADGGGSGLDWLVPTAAAAQSRMLYCGAVDLGMFGGPPVKGGFALGYVGTDDFWAAHADVSLGPTGTPLVPPFMNLYTVGGGLGYNVALDSFASGSSCEVGPKIDHTPVFNAHLVVGDPGHEVYGFDGQFAVKVSGPEAGARMDYKAWLVRDSSQWQGPGDFHGYFQYANGSFDGTLNGHYGFLDDKVYIEAAKDAIAMHFGGGQWYIHAGTSANPVKGHVLVVDEGAWLGLGSDGAYAGAKAHLHEGAGNCGGACAEVSGDTALQAAIKFQPVHIDASADSHMHARACGLDICLSAGLGTHIHVAALPPELAFGFTLGGCPPGHLKVGLRILPSPKPSVGGNLCLL